MPVGHDFGGSFDYNFTVMAIIYFHCYYTLVMLRKFVYNFTAYQCH